MGSFFSFGGKPIKVLVSGLDNAGKTTIIYQINTEDYTKTIPTLGLLQKAKYKNLEITSWDSGGHSTVTEDRIKQEFLREVAGFVFVVDASDAQRVNESAEELRKELSWARQDPSKVPLLILANKMDLPNAMSVEAIVAAFDLNLMQERAWHVQPCNAITKFGLIDGFEWLKKEIEKP